jgi:hypothetical protein
MDQCIHQISVRYRRRRAVHQLQLLQSPLWTFGIAQLCRLCLEVIFLYTQLLAVVCDLAECAATWMNKGMNEWSWKYISILSLNVSLDVGEKRYGPSIFEVRSNGLMMEYFSFIFTLRGCIRGAFLTTAKKLTASCPHQNPSCHLTTSTSTTY